MSDDKEITLKMIYDRQETIMEDQEEVKKCLVGDPLATPPVDGLVQEVAKNKSALAFVKKAIWVVTPSFVVGLTLYAITA